MCAKNEFILDGNNTVCLLCTRHSTENFCDYRDRQLIYNWIKIGENADMRKPVSELILRFSEDGKKGNTIFDF